MRAYLTKIIRILFLSNSRIQFNHNVSEEIFKEIFFFQFCSHSKNMNELNEYVTMFNLTKLTNISGNFVFFSYSIAYSFGSIMTVRDKLRLTVLSIIFIIFLPSSSHNYIQRLNL